MPKKEEEKKGKARVLRVFACAVRKEVTRKPASVKYMAVISLFPAVAGGAQLGLDDDKSDSTWERPLLLLPG